MTVEPVTTERLRLRPMVASDLSDYLAYAQDDEVMRYIRAVAPVEAIKQDFAGYIAPWNGDEQVWMALAVELLENGTVIGDLGCRYTDKSSLIMELGYKFHRSYHGKGLASEAVQAFAPLVLSAWPVHKFVAYADAENTGSTSIMKKLGMVQEGLFRSHYRNRDRWTDEVAYGVLVDSKTWSS